MSSPPSIHYFGLGGTISSVRSQEPGAHPTLSPQDIAASAPGIAEVAELTTHAFRLAPSAALTVPDVLELVAAMRDAVRNGADGFVVSQGTDTIEETAFLLDLLWERPEPIVVTGAMRHPSLPGADGPANLLAAVRVAAEADARDLGVLVVLADEIHAARFVQKRHASSPGAFVSPGLGPIGWVSEGRPVLALAPRHRVRVNVDERTAAAGPVPRVALVLIGLDDDCRQLEGALALGYDGVVLAGLGGGHVPPAGVQFVSRLTSRVPVILTSRAGAGEALSETYGFVGSEIDLLARGVLRAGVLPPVKARLLLVLCLLAGMGRQELADTFRRVGCTTGPVEGG